MSTTLVTGGTGFVGANLVRHLLEIGQSVHLLVRPGHASWRVDEVIENVTLVPADITDASQTARAFDRVQPDVVFHLAAYGAYPDQTDPRRMIDVNVSGTWNLLEAAIEHSVDAFIHTGSSSEYGFKTSAPSESERLDPNSHYAVTKASATHLCQLAARQYDVHAVTLRLYSVYGPYEEPSRLIPRLLTHALDGRLPPLVAPNTARDFIHVLDVCDALVRIADRHDVSRGAVFNVGSGRQTSLRELVDLVTELFGIEASPEWGSMERREWDTSHWVADPAKMHEVLDWSARVDLSSGLSSTFEWITADPARQRRYRE